MNLNFIRELFFRNLPYKITALILTLILWVFLAKEKNLEVGLKAKLIVKTKRGLVLSGDVPDEINIRVVGPKIFLQPLLFRQMAITIDLSDADEGETSFNILRSMINLPWGVNISGISPSSVTAKIEKIETKTVPIHVVFEGNPPLGYSLKNQVVEPEVAVISGPKDEVSLIKYINTKPIKLTNITESFSKDFKLELPSTKIVLKDIKNAKVNVTVSENMATKVFDDIKLEVFNCILKCKLDPLSIAVTLKGPKALLSNLQNRDIKVYIDAASKPKGTYASKAVIELPARTTVEKVKPSWFKLTVF